MTVAAAPETDSVADLTVVPCKCCGAPAMLFGAVDFNRSCEDRNARVFEPSGVDIPYHRCTGCGFAFTIAFDEFTPELFRQHIYNEAYPLVDPDFADARPTSNADVLHRTFGHAATSLRVLDYGGGNGLLAQRLRERGFTDVVTYDPFYEGSVRPQGTFDLVTSFEVLEHTPAPQQTFAELAGFRRPDGLLFCSTLLQPADILTSKLSWWYAAPRNGHVSLYTTQALSSLAQHHGLTIGSCDALLHVAFRGSVPAWARGLIGTP